MSERIKLKRITGIGKIGKHRRFFHSVLQLFLGCIMPCYMYAYVPVVDFSKSEDLKNVKYVDAQGIAVQSENGYGLKVVMGTSVPNPQFFYYNSSGRDVSAHENVALPLYNLGDEDVRVYCAFHSKSRGGGEPISRNFDTLVKAKDNAVMYIPLIPISQNRDNPQAMWTENIFMIVVYVKSPTKPYTIVVGNLLAGKKGETIIFNKVNAWVRPFTVKAVSDRPSLIFTEKESVAIRARIEGGNGPVRVAYQANETMGQWNFQGVVNVPRVGEENTELAIPIPLHGRGHYTILLNATCGKTEARDKASAAIIREPLPTSHDSPWGIMYLPAPAPKGSEKSAEALIAENMRMLGASWVRLNFWINMYTVKVEGNEVVLDLAKLRRLVSEFRKNGIHIMGEFVQTPKALSSMPDSNETAYDAGPLFCRVKPRDYALWDQMIEKMTREFSDDIQLWEIWNEPDMPKSYWSGTTEEFVELLGHTAAAIRRANPAAKLVASGFTHMTERCEAFFKSGFGTNIDFLSAHYIDTRGHAVDKFEEMLAAKGLKLPIIDTEENAVIPLNNLSRGIRSFKFIHFSDNNPFTMNSALLNDWDVTPSAVTYSVGTRLIGGKKISGSKDFSGIKAYFFENEGGIAAIANYRTNDERKPAKLLEIVDRIMVKCVPQEGKTIAIVDALGREYPFPGGEGEVPFVVSMHEMINGTRFASPCVFLRNCKDVVSIEGITGGIKDAIVMEAEYGEFDRDRIQVSGKPAFSGGKILNIWCKDEPGPKGYGSEMEFTVRREADYRVFFSGNSLQRIASSVSCFSWCIDDGGIHQVKEPVRSITGIPGAPEGLSELGTVRLTPGKHSFSLKLTTRRKLYDSYYALWLDAIALVPVSD